MASVYKAYEPGLDRSVAVKVLPAEFLHEPTFAERFKREAQVVAKLEHPNIIPIYAYGIDDGLPWMSMRLIGGGALSGVFKGGVRLKPARLVHYLRSVGAALDYAHAAGVIHRDIKPQNILVDERDHVYLADFGLAKMVEGAPGLTQTGMIAGTPEYMAPEQAMGASIDSRVDIYSLGVVAYACLTGRVPFTADTPLAVLMKHVRDPIPLPSKDEVPEPLMQVLLKAMAKTPNERWPTAGAFVDAVAHALEPPTLVPHPLHGPVTVVSPPPLPAGAQRGPAANRAGAPPKPADKAGSQPGRPDVAKPLVLGGVALLVIAAIAGAAFLWALRRASSGAAATTPPVTVAEAASARPAPPPEAPAPVRPTPQAFEAQPSPTRAAEPTPRPQAPATRPAPGTADPTPPPATPLATQPPPPAVLPPETAPPTPATAPAPDSGASTRPATTRAGTPFRFGSKIPLGAPTQGPVRLDTVLFKLDRGKTELQAEVAGHCAEGKDHTVEIQLEMLDGFGQTVTLLKGKGGIEEDENGTVKAKQKLAADQLARIASFRLTFQARPD
jgi:serine/threonine-protein kinase